MDNIYTSNASMSSQETIDRCDCKAITTQIESFSNSAIGGVAPAPVDPNAIMAAKCTENLAILVTFDSADTVACYAVETDGATAHWKAQLNITTVSDNSYTRVSTGIWRLDDTQALVSYMDGSVPYVQAVEYVNGNLQKVGSVLQLSTEQCLHTLDTEHGEPRTKGLTPADNHVRLVSACVDGSYSGQMRILITVILWDGSVLTEYETWEWFGHQWTIYDKNYKSAVGQGPTPDDIIVIFAGYALVIKFATNPADRAVYGTTSDFGGFYGNPWIERIGVFKYLYGGTSGIWPGEVKLFELYEDYVSNGLMYYGLTSLVNMDYVDDGSTIGFSSNGQMFVQEAIGLNGKVMALNTTSDRVESFSLFEYLDGTLQVAGPYGIMASPYTGCAINMTGRVGTNNYALGAGWDSFGELHVTVFPLF